MRKTIERPVTPAILGAQLQGRQYRLELRPLKPQNQSDKQLHPKASSCFLIEQQPNNLCDEPWRCQA